ncbi:cullin [Anaeramoeba flamelloides]|uniref:Cullin n=1 Tax=Anaeramoeba flamelloides TaxID=1746091 RepID=A0ABQ8XIV3_9EUKA|nr:cullin [Anaeramoeba flamelloides]
MNFEPINKLLNSIFEGNTSKITYYSHYKEIYSHIVKGTQKQLYEYSKKEIQKHTKKLANFIDDLTTNNFLIIFNLNWKKYSLKIDSLQQIFSILDLNYLKKRKSKPLYRFCLDLWKKFVFDETKPQKLKVLENLVDLLIEQIHKERNGEKIDPQIIRSLLNMFMRISYKTEIYEKWFEKPFLDSTKKLFQSKSLKMMESNTLSNYFRKVELIYLEENKRVDLYLPGLIRGKLKTLVADIFIRNQFEKIKNSETSPSWMIKNYKKDELKIVYLFLKRINEKKWLIDEFINVLNREGGDLVNKYAKNKTSFEKYQTTKDIMNLRLKINSIIKDSFKNDHDFINRGDKCFHQFLNGDSNVAKNLPLFMDYQIKYLNKKKINEIKAILSIFAEILKFINDKDLFQKYYEFYLSRRLIKNYKSEKLIIKQIQSKSWSLLTLKMEDMFNGVDQSKKEFQDFCLYLDKVRQNGECVKGGEQILFKPYIMKRSIWPKILNFNLNLSPMLEESVNIFKKYYCTKYTNRLLSWQFNVGLSEIEYTLQAPKEMMSVEISEEEAQDGGAGIDDIKTENLKKGTKESSFTTFSLVVSTIQMVVLLAFNNNLNQNMLSYSCKQLRKMINIPFYCLKDAFIGLISKKTPILKRIKFISENKIHDQDIFTLNTDFFSSEKKIKVKNVVQTIPDTQHNAIDKKIGIQRDVLIECEIVQIMKKRKNIPSKDLISLVLQSLQPKFKPTVSMIEQRIRNLIDREYLKKDLNIIVYIP